MDWLPDRVRDKISPCPLTGCWFFSGSWDSGNGYGKMMCGGVVWMFHRLVYTLTVGPIPEGLVLDHKCRTRICCNPDHLEPVTPQENTRRGNAILFAIKIEPYEEGDYHDRVPQDSNSF